MPASPPPRRTKHSSGLGKNLSRQKKTQRKKRCDGICVIILVYVFKLCAFKTWDEGAITHSLEKLLRLLKKKVLVGPQVCQQTTSEKKGESYEKQAARSQRWWKHFLKSKGTAESLLQLQKARSSLKLRQETNLKDKMGKRKIDKKFFLFLFIPFCLFLP